MADPIEDGKYPMMRLAQSAALLTLSLLASAATVYAECTPTVRRAGCE